MYDIFNIRKCARTATTVFMEFLAMRVGEFYTSSSILCRHTEICIIQDNYNEKLFENWQQNMSKSQFLFVINLSLCEMHSL